MKATGSRTGLVVRIAFVLAAILAGQGASFAQTKDEGTKVRLQLLQSRLRNPVQSETETPPESYFFKARGAVIDQSEQAGVRKGWFRDVYPGIDLVLYGDDSNLEYVFVVNSGADPSAIAFQLEGQTSTKQSHAGNVTFGIPNGEINMYKPSIVLEKDGQTRQLSSGFETSADGIKIDLRAYLQEKSLPLNGSQFNLVKGGGQPGGPQYDFYITKYELSNEQLMTFLNDMEETSAGTSGTTMSFDDQGNAWMNPAMKSGTHDLFNIKNSKLVYDPTKKPGARFSHAKEADGKAAYSRHPASGLSWFGCVKYCNWLTHRAGRDSSEVAYNEGQEPDEWKPVTATNWASGQFSDDERSQWIKKKGFRLPMLDSDAESITTNDYNEFYKCSAWDGITNRQFGFGRDSFSGTEANFADTTNREWTGFAPIGYFDGITRLGKKNTRPSANYSGLYDTSGNAAEWLNDPAKPGVPGSRCAAGGSYDQSATPLSKGAIVPPSDTSGAKGMRLMTTYMSKERLFIHVLFSFYMTPKEAEEGTEGVDGMGVDGVEGEGTDLDETSTDDPLSEEEEAEQTGETAPPIESVSSDILPDAISYTVDPDVAIDENEEEEETPVVPPEEPSSDGEPPVDEPPVIVPPPEEEEPRDPTLFIFSSNPSSGVYIAITSTNLTNSVSSTTPFDMEFPTNVTITLGAPQYGPNGEIFDYWDCSIDAYDTVSQVLTFVMPQSNITFTAVYRTPVTLTVGSVSPESGVNIQVSAPDVVTGQQDGQTEFQREYWPGTTVTLTAPTNAPGVNANAFHHWVIDGVSTTLSRTVTFTIYNDMTAEAVFAPHLLRVRSSGSGNNEVFVTVFPNDYFGDGSGVTPFDLFYDHNVVVSLSTPAVADNGNVFQNWLVDGVNVGTNLTTSVVMGGDHLITAVYVYMPDDITDPTVSPGGI